MKKEQYNPEFLKINPQHTIPTLDDDGKIIWDSHAIMIYLVTKYGKDNSLYPEAPFMRAVINQRLHFDSGVVYSTFIRIISLLMNKISTTIMSELANEAHVAYDFLEKFLEGHLWVACEFLTLADLSLIPSITTLDIFVPINEKYPNITNWIKRAEQLPYYHINKKGLEICRNLAKTNNVVAQ
ncbi:hypothetical protein RI129_008273 [Pyrocoelia pectoralis]|uniref:Glutathione S-transferase n=1 Tax=Pyrocoelia pectoralis TaxID=417401 RepID=A0AAN7VBN9_9COLE